MLQNHCQTLGFKKNVAYKIPLCWGVGVNHTPASGLITLISCHNPELWVEMLTL